ncbi:MAG: CDP-diacylglycerol--serine O-phosphatidyltransferase [Bacteroidetes bacterium]|nr:CDP-diacylglycerol--serine O-phosphatidyltransferase [Bacteroidota bacterium]MBU1371393.1 CDP-diacylglycerol--serine O-phosphatidyltransferase [Bacteroidota bacterium]MBU1485664.1 CDP-diacylglycerol--serine O-phosphatidyltransferase [Bacteroidota bacterium]MBU1761904.1 CDP-diacylglycerol--serine O-phosphatidyltransferase [Bacteroidota bacterium]MBU2266932.1 CDP-diacylglycerol--serine O-phosphatidyltransferase [Bacteroidota bacterium]
MIKKHIPNALTCANLFSGCIGIVYAFNGDLKTVAFFVVISGIFDFFDGFAARLLHVKSAIGKELDSLADMVSFGFLPSVVMYQLLGGSTNYLAYAGFVIAVFSALRLAKFNIDERQTEEFIGLNTPMNTFFIISLPYLADQFIWVNNKYFLLTITLICSLLLVSELKLFSMKISGLNWSKNKFKFIFLILSIVLFAFLKFAAIPIILILYILFSQIHFKYSS